MSTQQILPVLDLAVLQEKANAFAMQGATESLKEFYLGWNGAYRKAIDEDLKNKGLAANLDLPDIVGILNETLSNTVDGIVSEAIAKSFIPQVKRFFTREEPEILFSDFLKQFIQYQSEKEPYNFECSVDRNVSYGWLNIKISCEDKQYELTLHEQWETRKKEGIEKKYNALSLPYESKTKQNMVLSFDGAKLELPFTRDILKDDFLSYVARLIMCKSNITMDVTEFDDDMFSRDECHCD